jgi:hypothetical protein
LRSSLCSQYLVVALSAIDSVPYQAAAKSELIITGTNPWNSLNEYYDTLELEFTSLTQQLEAQTNLCKIRLEKDKPLDTFCCQFRTEAEASKWNDKALIATF